MSHILTADERYEIWSIPKKGMVMFSSEINSKKREFEIEEVSELRDRIKQLEQDLAEAKKSIKSVIQHYEDGAVYFERNYEAFYTDSFQDLMVDIYKKHDEAVKESSK